MAVTKVDARAWAFAIWDPAANAGAGGYVEVGGINSMTIGRESETTDTTDFDSAGKAEHQIMQRGRTITIEGFHLEDPGTGARDSGQQLVESLAEAVGDASLQDFQITSPGGTTYTQKVSAELGDVGGGNNDKTSWSATLARSGGTTVV